MSSAHFFDIEKWKKGAKKLDKDFIKINKIIDKF